MESPTAQAQARRRVRRTMSGGRIATLVIGVIVALISLALLAAGVTGLAFDSTQRDSDDFLSSESVDIESRTYAVVASGLQVDTDAPDWLQVRSVTGDIRVEAEGDDAVFLGLARESTAAAYLANLEYDEVTDIDGGDVTYRTHDGGPPVGPPQDQDFWADSASGAGEQRLTFEPQGGRWVVVAMNSDASPGLDLSARVGAEVPALVWVSIGLLIAGVVGLIVASVLIYVAVRHLGTPAEEPA